MGRLGTTILCVCYGIALLGLIFLIDKHEDLVSSIALFIMAGWGIWWVIKKIAHSEDKREAVKLLFYSRGHRCTCAAGYCVAFQPSDWIFICLGF